MASSETFYYFLFKFAFDLMSVDEVCASHCIPPPRKVGRYLNVQPFSSVCVIQIQKSRF